MATFILAIVIYTTGVFLSPQSFSMYTDMSYNTFYTWHFPLLSPLLLTWHPPVVTGIVHLSPRLLVDYPLCPPLLPCTFPPQIPNPLGFPGPNVLLIRVHHKPSSQYTRHYQFFAPVYTVTIFDITVKSCLRKRSADELFNCKKKENPNFMPVFQVACTCTLK